MNQNTSLFAQFKGFDNDGDGKLSVDEAYQLLKSLGKNIYKGSINIAAKLVNYNNDSDDNQKSNDLFTFSQFEEFFESLESNPKHEIWKSKYSLLELIHLARKQNPEKMSQSAAPTESFQDTSADIPADIPFKGDIEITVGQPNQNYNSCVHLKIQKKDKSSQSESKPFMEIVFQQSSVAKAIELEAKFTTMKINLQELLKSVQPEFQEIINCINITTKVSENKLSVLVTTSHQSLIELGIIFSQLLDRSLDSKINAKVNLQFDFNIDIQDFMDESSNYNFYNALTQNCHLRLLWNVAQLRKKVKIFLKKIDSFDELQSNKLQPLPLFLISLLHTELCSISLAYDNVETQDTQLQSKNEILQGLNELKAFLTSQQYANLGILQAISSFENSFEIFVSIGDWQVYGKVKIENLNQLILKSKV